MSSAHKYHDHLIGKKLISHSLDRTTTHSRDDNASKKWARWPFLGNVCLKIARILPSVNIEHAFYSFNTPKNLSKLKDRIPPHQKSGVCQLLRTPCPGAHTHVGRTNRKLLSRFNEDETAHENHPLPPAPRKKYNLVKHLLSENYL